MALIPETSPDYDTTRIIERPDGYYWQDKETGKESGPFATLAAAMADLESNDTEHELAVGETPQEAEDEVGIATWIDPETGLPAEGSVPRIEDL
ncbi:MAG TPA: hypothetical protein VJ673_13825 [Aromatoleum sp.]|uniref:hypothetical protein n=1 Tax=Aromatoleum sp. TaxID=2307007 RepID=UPI002B466099|nr:hypothetical protein [Aromatoleum sp.]HJV26761.1 hypothetical protein [Aromatoleum sp.]